MTRILCIADNHWGDGSRADECTHVHEWIVGMADELEPDLIVDSGDIYDGPASPAHVEAASAWLQQMARYAPVIVVSGNHDRAESVVHFGRLDAEHPIYAHERPGVLTAAGVAVAMLPWPSKGELLAALGQTSQGEVRATSPGALQAILRGLDAGLDCHPGLPRILLAHCSIEGAQTSTGQPLVGLDFGLWLADLALVRADAYVLGHIHCRQSWDVGGAPAFYPGSPYRRTFCETEPKGIALLELKPGQPARMTWIDSPAEELITLEDAWATDHEMFGAAAQDDGPIQFRASFRLRYTVPAERVAEAAAQVARVRDALLSYGATSVKVEPHVLVSNHARIPEVATSRSIADQLGAYWSSKPDEYSEELRTRLLGCLARLEEGATRAASGAIRLEKIHARGLGVLGDVSIDLTALPPASKLVAVAGPNGSGKSSLLELWSGGALYRECASRGSLVELAEWAGTRDALLKATVVNGQLYCITHVIDGVARDSSAVVECDGAVVPATRDGKVSSFDRWAATTMPPPAVLYSGAVALQRGDGLLDPSLTKGDRKRILLRALGTEQLEGMVEAARKRAQEAGEAAKVAEAKLQVERERAGDMAQAKADLEVVRAEAIQATAEVPHLTGLVDQARAEVERTKLLASAWETKSAEAEQRRREATQASQRLAELTQRVDSATRAATEATGTIADLEPQVPGLAAEVERCRRWVSEVAEQTRIYREKVEAATDLRSQLHDSARRASDLHTRATNNEAVLAEADAIRKAVADREGAIRLAQHLERQALEMSARQRETLAQAMSAGQAAREAESAAAAAKRRTETLLAELQEESAVRRAAEELEAARADEEASAQQLAKAEAELEHLRGQRVAGAADRAVALRRGLLDAQSALVTIAQPAGGIPQAETLRNVQALAEDAEHSVDGVLAADKDCVRLAEELPVTITRKAAEVARARVLHEEVRKVAATLSTWASRVQRMDAARVELDAAAEERATRLAAAQSQLQIAQELGAASKGLALEVEQLSQRASEQKLRAEQLKPMADKAGPLANAETRLSELRPQLQVAREEWKHLRAELDDLEVWIAAQGHNDPEEPSEALRCAELQLAGVKARIAEAGAALAGWEATARELEPQIEATKQAAERARSAVHELAAWLAEHQRPDVDAYAEALQGAELALRIAQERATSATAALAVAEARHATAMEAAGRIQALEAEAREYRQQQADWTLLGQDLGPNGLQAALIDAAGPQLTEMANDLLHGCVGQLFTVSFETTRHDAKGKRQLEDCDVRVYDAEAGRWKVAKRLSGGELALVSLAVSLAMTQLSCQRQGVRGCTLVRDESGAALDAERATQYVAMLRRAAEAIGADRVLLVSHVPAVVELCDARIEMCNGEARYA